MEAYLVTCSHCQGAERVFDRDKVSQWLDEYRQGGPGESTKRLISLLIDSGVAGDSLLDIGGGIGAIPFELFDAGLESATLVEASAAAVEAARSAAMERGLSGRMEVLFGDYVDLAPGLTGADIVTLDRVICCYPDMTRLVGYSSAQAGRTFGAVYPRGVWWARLFVLGLNMWFRVVRNPFRVYVHPPEEIDSVLRGNGFSEAHRERSGLWELVVYRKRNPVQRSSAAAA